MNTALPRLFATMGISAVIGLALPVTAGAAASTGQTSGLETEVVAKLTGPASLNRTHVKWNVHGTDLGHMFRYKKQLRFTFGDTFGPARTDHRDNTMAWSTDTSLHNGLKFKGYVTDRPGHAKKLFDDPSVANVIPTYGIAEGDRMFLHYMAVRRWGDPGRWDVAYSGLAYSDNEGRTWTMDPNVKWGDQSNFAQVAFVRPGDGYIYLCGITEGRFGGVKLARVP
ncbi:MAG: DUF4185 domain-containing protein, partial [Actinomycetota bacterium]|nr:DUF4185 domain-containing protein [Actinomycetota bacterium]